MQAKVGHEQWMQTGAVRWVFRGENEHLWDRVRHLAKVRWGRYEVLVDLSKKTGLAFVDGQAVSGEKADQLIKKAWAHWANDSFWLNPIAKLFDEGTTRGMVKVADGRNGVMVTYASGGVTPGDSYVWFIDPSGMPVAWKMWVSILPIKGLEASWEDWQTLTTGAKVARKHKIGPLTLELSEIEGAVILDELISGPDPFAPLFQ